MKKFILLLALLSVVRAEAGDFAFFLGGGFGMGQLGLDENAAEAKFRDFTYNTQGGVLWQFDTLGLVAGAAFGEARATGSLEDSNTLEGAKNTFTTLKAGVLFHNITVGGGTQNNSLLVKSVTVGSGSIESKYSGATPFYFVSYGLNSDAKGRGADFRTNIEISQSTGAVESVQMDQLTLSINVVILLGSR